MQLFSFFHVQMFDLNSMRHQVAAGNFSLRPHAMQHAVKEGFRQADIVYVALNGKMVEDYPERRRCLLYAQITIEGARMPLHVVCEHLAPDLVVDFVTAYIPAEWKGDTRRR